MGIGTAELTLAELAAFKYHNVNFVNVPGGELLYTVEGHPKTVIVNLGELLNIATGEVQGDAVAIDELTATQIADDAVTGSELAETPSLFESATEVTFDHDTATAAVLVAANAAGGGDRVVLCQTEVTAAFVSTSWEIDVGSTGSLNGMFDNIFAGLADLSINETVAGAYLLPEGEALIVTKTSMVGASAGQLTFRLIVLTPGAKSIPGALLEDDAVGDFETSTTVNVADTEGPTKQLLASDAVNDRLCLVMGVATVTAAGGPDFDVGSAVTAINSCFDDISSGAWVIGDRWVGACMLPAGEALVCTIGAGTAGAIDFHVIPLTVVGSGTKNLFQAPAAPVTQDFAAGVATLLAANAAGGGDRLVLVQAEVTTAFAGTAFEWDVGSGATPAGLFDNIFTGAVPTAIGMSVLGAYLLPEGEALVTALTTTTLTAGAIEFRTYVATPAAGSIPGNLLANDAVGHFQDSGVMAVPSTIGFGGGAAQDLLAADPSNDRLCIVMGIATIASEAGVNEWDVGSETTDNDSLFDDIAAGTWVAGERWVGACMLPATEKLQVFLTTAGSAGSIDFYVIPLTLNVQSAQIAAGALAADVTGRAIMATGLFDAATALDKIAAAALVGSLLDNDAVNFPYGIAPTPATFGDATVSLLALDATIDRIVIVTGIVTETAVVAGVPQFDVGAGAGTEVFSDIAAGSFVIGERFVGSMVLPAGSALNCTVTPGAASAGAINFYVQILTPLVQTAQIADSAVTTAKINDASITGVKLAATPSLFETATTHDQHHDTGAGTILAANAAGQGDRLVIVQAECTEAFSDVTTWEWQVGSASDPNGLFADIFAGVATLGVGETVVGSYLLPEAEILALVETDMTVGGAPTGIIRFRILHSQAAAGSIPGALLADDAIGLFEDITPTTVAFGGGATQQILALDATSNRHVLVMAIATVAAESGVCDWDVGAGAGNEVFDDISDGTWIAGERWMGACDLAAGDALNVTLQTAGAAGSIDFYVIALTPLAATANIENDAVTPDKVADIAAESATAGVGIKMAMAEYTFVNLAADAGMFGATSIPSGALVVGGYLEVVTALSETNGGGEVDVGLDLEGANDILADAAWNGAPWSAPGFYDILPDMGGASYVLTTAPRDITISIVLNGATNIAGGVIRVVLFYIEPKTGAI